MIENIGAYSQVDYDRGYQQGRADALSIDIDKPMHFTDEQKAWIKNYIIINAKRQRASAIDEFANKLLEELSHTTLLKDGYYLANIIKPLAEQLKENKNGKD